MENLEIKNSPLLLGAFGTAAFAAITSVFALLFSFFSLPDQVPLLFTAGQGLTNKIFLLAIPLLSILLLIGNAAVAEVFLRRGERAAALFPAALSTFISVILAGSLIRIIKIFPLPPLPFEETIYPLLLPLGLAAGLGFVLSALFAWAGRRLRLFDFPHGPYPKVRAIPRLGTIPLLLTFSTVAILFTNLDRSLAALIAGAAVIAAIQMIDDLHPLPAWLQGAGHLLAGLIVILGGIGIDFITNPLAAWIGDPQIRLDNWVVAFNLFGTSFQFAILSDLFTIVWIFVLVNVVDWLDGLDGLATGVGAIAAAAIVAISFITGTQSTALLGIILVGALLGFLPLNFFPAQIYLGGGAFLIGYFLAVLSIFSGAKTGTATLVLALPIIDALYVVYRRILAKQSPFKGDTNHLHHRLIEVGLSQTQIVFLEWAIVALLAVAAIILTGVAKFAAVGFVFIAAILANKLLLSRLGSKTPGGAR